VKTEERPTDLDGDVGRDRFRLPARSFVLKVHRWLSLGALVWILIISLTGVVLVFAPQITARAHPELFRSTPGEMKSPQEMVDAALAHFPDDDVAIDESPRASSTGASGGTTSSGRTRGSSASPATTSPASWPWRCSSSRSPGSTSGTSRR
jgi:uncharacterized iron-regulated membrane protein